ncbi:hypothetical protein ACG9XS_00780 [Acinetobacter gyllenbergii]|uniref:hypothetical protein n=1 Tax=Acinetobacter gyllenbergii TaxID=134534 RepID=UPI0003BE320F|nr:hypothetical protein [Acinetobacter gyllenbergii]ESK57754.1 hypothetical protein F987_00105 [Acinetobacter gyllenbergii NIPH 230]
MGIEYFIIAMDESASKDDLLNIFSPYWVEIEHNYYLLNYGNTQFQNLILNNECHFSINFHENNSTVESITIYKPCSDIKLEQAIYRLIQNYPMFLTYPRDPLIVITANSKCLELIRKQYPDLLENLKLVSCFEEYHNLE